MEVKVISVSLASERGRKYCADKIEFDKSGVIGDEGQIEGELLVKCLRA